MTSNKSRKNTAGTIVNRRAKFDYQLGDDLQVGLSLTGMEVRAARDGHVQLKGSFISIKNGELWLNNASFSLKNNEKNNPNARTIDTSPRKILAKRKEIDQMIANKQKGMTIVPLRLLTNRKYIKLVIALGKGKKLHDKRETLKRRQHDRESAKALKNYR